MALNYIYLLELDNGALYILLSNIYASYEDVERIELEVDELDCLSEPSLCLQMKL